MSFLFGTMFGIVLTTVLGARTVAVRNKTTFLEALASLLAFTRDTWD